MSDLFLRLLNSSLTACPVVLAVAGLRLVLRNAPRRLICAMWLLVALRLLCPVLPESSLSLQPAVQPVTRTVAGIQTARFPVPAGGIVPAETEQLALPAEEAVQQEAQIPEMHRGTWDRLLCAAFLWAVGAAAMLLYGALGYIRVRHRVSVARCAEKGIRYCDYIDTPFVLGLLRPEICLPSGLGQEQIPYILAHERAHIRRGDPWWKLLGFVLLCLHWFNPMLWLAYRLFCRDVELACDEAVIRTLDAHGKAEYSRALLRCSAPAPLVFGLLGFGRSDVKNRIRRVLGYRRPSVWISLLAVTAIGVGAVCFLTNPPAPGRPEADMPIGVAETTQPPETETAQTVPEVPYAQKKNAPAGTIPPMEEIQDVVVFGEKGTVCLSAPEEIARAVRLLQELYDAAAPIEGYDPSDDPNPWCRSVISLETADSISEFCFSGDTSAVMFPDASGKTTAYPVRNPGAVRAFVEEVTRTTLGKQTAGNPTAGIREPALWLKNVRFDAIRDVYLYRSEQLANTGAGTSQAATFGWMRYDRASQLPQVLRQVDPASVSEKSGLAYNTFPLLTAFFPGGSGVSVRFVDGANGFAAVFRMYGNTVELVLCDEPEKLNDRADPPLRSYTVWEIADEGLKNWLRALGEAMPVVLPTAGAEYDWASPVSSNYEGCTITVRPIAGWTVETEQEAPFGIRIRPGDCDHGWIYFSAQPQGFREEDSGCSFLEIGKSYGYTVTAGYAGTVDPANYNFFDTVWQYLLYRGKADFLIRNEDADDWLPAYMDAISDIITFSSFEAAQ